MTSYLMPGTGRTWPPSIAPSAEAADRRARGRMP
jgi:hypothetical protein